MRNVLKIFLIFLFLSLTGGIVVFYYIIAKSNVTVKDEGIIYIQSDDSFDNVVHVLTKKGYINNLFTFNLLAKLKKYPSHLKTGCYKLKDGMSNNQLVNMLRSGQQEAIHFTFNNVRTFNEFAKILSRQLSIDSSAFMSITQDTVLIDSLGFSTSNFIGMFIPNTYEIYWNTSLQNFILRMHSEYKKFWTTQRINKAQQIGLSPIEIITLASIVEEETNIKNEYSLIAGVYINRLKKGWKLEACPTLKFALNDFTIKRILDKHIATESLYNTYKYAGLPPGPIRMPSIQVIDAVLDYTKHKYMFFCAKSDFSGSHYFSQTLREHNRHASDYHKKLNQKKIY